MIFCERLVLNYFKKTLSFIDDNSMLSSLFFLLFLPCSGVFYLEFSPLGYNFQRLIFSIFCLFCFLSIFKKILSGQPVFFFSKFFLLILSLVIGFGTFSAISSKVFYKSIQEVSLYGLFVISAFAIASENFREKEFIVGFCFIGFSILIYFYGFIFIYALCLEFPPKSWANTIYQYSNPRTLNHIQNWLIPIFSLLPFFTKEELPLVRKLSWLPLVIMYFFLFLSSGRGVSLALVSSMLISLFLFRKSILELLIVHMKGIWWGFLLYIVMIQVIPALLGVHGQTNTLISRVNEGSSGRFSIWAETLVVIKENLWFGLGPQHFVTAQDKFSSPHNIILQWFSEWGLPAALCMILLSLWGGWSYLSGLKNRLQSDALTKEQEVTQISIFMALLSAGIHAQVSGVFVTPVSQMLMVLVVGYALKVHWSDQKPVRFVDISIFSVIVIGVLLLYSVLYFITLFWEFFLGNYKLFLIDDTNAPRFWLNGAFHRQ